jgi:hypothetical protein
MRQGHPSARGARRAGHECPERRRSGKRAHLRQLVYFGGRASQVERFLVPHLLARLSRDPGPGRLRMTSGWHTPQGQDDEVKLDEFPTASWSGRILVRSRLGPVASWWSGRALA